MSTLSSGDRFSVLMFPSSQKGPLGVKNRPRSAHCPVRRGHGERRTRPVQVAEQNRKRALIHTQGLMADAPPSNSTSSVSASSLVYPKHRRRLKSCHVALVSSEKLIVSYQGWLHCTLCVDTVM